MQTVRAVCEYSKLRTSSKKGTPSINCKFKILGNLGQDAGYIWHDLWLTEKSEARTIVTLRDVFGWRGDNVIEFHSHHELLNNVEVELVLDYETYEGKTELKVKYVNSIGGVSDALTDITDDEAEKIGAYFRGRILLYQQNHPMKPVSPPNAKPKPSAVVPARQPAPTGGLTESDDLPPIDTYGDDGLPF